MAKRDSKKGQSTNGSSAPSVSKAVTTSMDWIKISVWVLIAIAIVALSVFFANKIGETGLNDIGKSQTQTQIDLDLWYYKLPAFVLGIDASVTLEVFLIQLMIFIIIFVAISDILQVFSSFSTWVAWTIGFAIAGIAGIGGAVGLIATIFGVTAGLGAVGISLIIIGSLIAAVTLNLGVGGFMRRWRMERQIEIESMKSGVGTSRVTDAIAGLKNIQRELGAGERV